MLLTIHNLPLDTNYADVKALIQSKCGLTGMILDNLMNDGCGKTVTVGVAEEVDAAVIVRKINGLHVKGMQLYVQDLRQKKASEQPYRSSVNLLYEAQNRFQEPRAQSADAQEPAPVMVPPPPPIMNYGVGMPAMYYMPQGQTSFMGYSQNQQTTPEYSEYLQQNVAQGFGTNDTNNAQQNLQSTWSYNENYKYGRNDYIQQRAFEGEQMPIGRQANDERSPIWDAQKNDRDNRRRQPSPQRDSWSSHNQASASWQYNRAEPQDNAEAQRSQKPFYQTNDSFERKYNAKPHERPATSNVFDSRASNSNVRAQAPNVQKGNCWVQPNNVSRWNVNDRGPGKGDSLPGSKRNLPRDDWKQRDRSPPAKRSRNVKGHPKAGPSANYPRANPAFDRNTRKVKKTPKVNIQKLFQRDSVSRTQASNDIVSQILSEVKHDSDIPKGVIESKMRTAVRVRLQILAEFKVQVKMGHLLHLYQRKFPKAEDQYFYNAVARRIKRDKERAEKKKTDGNKTACKPSEGKKTDTKNGGRPKVPSNNSGGSASTSKGAPVDKLPKNPQAGSGVPVPTSKGAPVGQLPKNPPTGSGVPASTSMGAPGDKLPNYPKGDKKLAIQNKKLARMAFVKGNNVFKPMNQLTKQVLMEEINVIKKLISDECSNPEDDNEKTMCDHIREPKVLETFETVMQVNVLQRMLNSSTLRVVRIYGTPKLPKKGDLQEFLNGRGVVSLKKSDRKGMFVATCGTIQSFDDLCTLESTYIGNVMVHFKPMYLTGPNKNILKQLARKAKTTMKINISNEGSIADELSDNPEDEEESTLNEKPQTQTESPKEPNQENDPKEIQSDSQEENESRKDQNEPETNVTKNVDTVSMEDQTIQKGDERQEIPMAPVNSEDGTQKGPSETRETVGSVSAPQEDQNGRTEVKKEPHKSENEAQNNTNLKTSGKIDAKKITTDEEKELRKDADNIIDEQVKKNQNASNKKDHTTVKESRVEDGDEAAVKDVNSTHNNSLDLDDLLNDFSVIDEIIGDDLGTDEEESVDDGTLAVENVDIDQIDEDDLEDY